MSTTYTPSYPVGLFTPQQQLWITSEFRAIKRALEVDSEHITLAHLHAQPERVLAGMLVLADGTDWDPGAGAGLYRRDESNASWVFIG